MQYIIKLLTGLFAACGEFGFIQFKGLTDFCKAAFGFLQGHIGLLQAGKLGAHLVEGADQVALADPVIYPIARQTGGGRLHAVFFQNSGNHGLNGFHFAFFGVHRFC